MMDLVSPRWILLKGALFLVLGFVAATLLVMQHPGIGTGLLLLTVIWSFCRFYYFLFYVIQHYVDPTYRFSGLLSIASYLLLSKRRKG